MRISNLKKINIICVFLIIALISISFISSSELRVTEEHPFLVNNEWISAKDLQIGDELRTVDGRIARITSIEDIVSDDNVSVYNLEAGSYHNFVVGDNDEEVMGEEGLGGDGEVVGLVDNSNDVAGRGWGGGGLVVHNSNDLEINPLSKKDLRRLNKKPEYMSDDEFYRLILGLSEDPNSEPHYDKPKRKVMVGKQVYHKEGEVEMAGSTAAVFVEEGTAGQKIVKVMNYYYSNDWSTNPLLESLRKADRLKRVISSTRDFEDYYQNEIEMMKVLDRLGLRKFYGEVEITNPSPINNIFNWPLLKERAYSMDYIEGNFPYEMEEYITADTYSDALTKYRKLWDEGYVQGDFQFFVTKAGKIEIIDAGGIAKRTKEDTWERVVSNIDRTLYLSK